MPVIRIRTPAANSISIAPDAVLGTVAANLLPGDPVWLGVIGPPSSASTHVASGEKRDVVTAARLKRMGVVSGFPDLIFFGINGRVCAVELKAEGGRLSEAQAIVKRHLEAAGHGYLVLSDYREVVETLKAWCVVRSGIHVQ